MNACMVENNIIANIIVIPDGDKPEDWGAKELPYGKWIGDTYDSDAELKEKLESLNAATWDQLAAAIQEGVDQV